MGNAWYCLAVAWLVLILSFEGANAVNPDERLDDPVLEQRARTISKELRCLQCQNQSIDDSDAGFSKDMRLLVRERLVAGDTDQEVVDYIVGRYGEFALLRPAFSLQNLALWLGPFLMLVLALAGLIWRLSHSRSRPTAASEALSSAEISQIDDILARRKSNERRTDT